MERTVSEETLRAKLLEAVTGAVTLRTRRDTRLPGIGGKVLAVIGVRRGGKTSFLQHLAMERMAEGRPRESQLLLALEDERLAGLTALDLGWLLDEHARQFPELREAGGVSLYLDEVHLVTGWETLVRRLIDAGAYTEIFVSGSSARFLSREVATSLRGRGLEVLMHPFSFREALRHASAEPTLAWERTSVEERSALEAALRRYLREGGFPEAQGTERGDRIALMKGYVDVMVLRDVIERYTVTNPHALRWLQRHLLSTPGGNFTVRKLHNSLTSQGIQVGKGLLYEYLAHLEDAFLLRTLSMHSTSERQRMTNPRKAYPIDMALIEVYERTGREHSGRALETAILLELDRRGYDVEWLRTEDGFEVDFFAERTGEAPLLLQVSLEITSEKTWQREVRALQAAAREYPRARALLITLDPTPPAQPLPRGVEWQPATRWLLEYEARPPGRM